MGNDLNKHHRRSILLNGYDYSQAGATANRATTRVAPTGIVSVDAHGQPALVDARTRNVGAGLVPARNSEKPRRQSIRLKGYDYMRTGAYFVTVCTQNRNCLFGEVVNGLMRLNAAGERVLTEWDALPDRFPIVELDAFVVMPNHLHGVIVITGDGDVGAGLVPARNVGTGANRATTRVAPTLGDVVGAFKSLTTVSYARGVRQSAWPAFAGRLWQRNYYEHIIRNEESLNRIRQYILDNPARWASDRENPLATEPEPENAWQT